MVKRTFTFCYIKNIFLFKNMKQRKNEHQYLYKTDDELKGDNITDENDGIIE